MAAQEELQVCNLKIPAFIQQFSGSDNADCTFFRKGIQKCGSFFQVGCRNVKYFTSELFSLSPCIAGKIPGICHSSLFPDAEQWIQVVQRGDDIFTVSTKSNLNN